MSDNNAPAAPVASETRAAPVAAPVAAAEFDLTRAMNDERARVSEIDAVGLRFAIPADKITSAKRDGLSADAFRKLALDFLGSKEAEASRAGAAMIGLTEREKDSFSVVRLLRHLASPDDAFARKAAGFEIEASRTAADIHKGQVRGIILPADITHHAVRGMGKRASDQLVGTPALGGNVVDDVLMSGSVIDILRRVSVLSNLGVRVFAGLRGDVSFPKQLTDVAAFWVSEDGAPTKAGITFGQVKMAPKTVAAMTELSRKLLIQDSVDVEAYVRMSIAASIALKIDQAGLNGDADPDAPNGLADEAGVNSVTFTTPGEPTYQEVVSMRTKVKQANALQGALGYTFDPVMEEHLLTTPKFGAGSDMPIMAEEGRLGGYRALASNQVAGGVKWFGNWSDLYMGLWSGLDVLVDPYSNSATGAVRITAHQDVDFAVARAASFTKGQ